MVETIQIKNGRAQVFELETIANSILRVDATQKGVDVELDLYDTDGTILLKVDSPNNAWGLEQFWWRSEQSGSMLLKVTPLSSDQSGSVDLIYQNRDMESASAYAKAFNLYTRGKRSLSKDPGKALMLLEEATNIWQELDVPLQEALCLKLQCQVLAGLKQMDDCPALYRRAIRRIPQKEIALRATFWNDYAILNRKLGLLESSLSCYKRALDLWLFLDQPVGWAETSGNLGVLLNMIDRTPDALRRFQDAVEIFDQNDMQYKLPDMYTQIGWSHFLDSQPEKALEYYHRALEFAEQTKSSPANIYSRMGALFHALGQFLDAEEALKRSLHHWQPHQMVNIVHTKARMAYLYSDMGRLEQANWLAEEALTYYQDTGDLEGLAYIRFVQGRTAYAAGHLDMALEQMERNQDVIQIMRDAAVGEKLKNDLSSARHLYLDFYLKLLAESGATDTALLEFDKNRQRQYETTSKVRMTQLELELKTLFDSPDLDREPRLSQLLVQTEDHLLNLLESAQLLRQKIPPLDIQSMQAMMDADTLGIFYALGEEKSHGWLVSQEQVIHFYLPPRRDLEADALNLLTALRKSLRPDGMRRVESFASKLSTTLLPNHMGTSYKRWVIVGDGLLQAIPFDVLRYTHHAAMVIEQHEIIYLPSWSLLKVLRERKTAKFSQELTLVYNPKYRPNGFGSLLGTVTEAKHILGHFGGEQTLEIYGVHASRDRILGITMEKPRILHIATHGKADLKHGPLSSLILSDCDERDQSRDSQVYAHEIAGLNLPCELVVLSACETGRGELNLGQPADGLVQGFLKAGAKRIVASLWKVDDKATAELMGHFYQYLKQEGLPPGSALRKAKLTMMKKSETKAAYYWASFVYVGDWLGFESN